MGLWDSIVNVGSYINGQQSLKVKLQKQNETMHRMQSGEIVKDVENLISRMDQLDTVLQGAEYTVRSSYSEKIASIRGKLGEVKDIISKPINYYNALDEIWTFVQDVKNTSRFTPGQNPLGEAKAYGKAMKSLGKIAGKIPLLNIYAEFLEQMGDIFAQTVANIVPHLKGTHQRVDEQIKRGGDRSIWEPV